MDYYIYRSQSSQPKEPAMTRSEERCPDCNQIVWVNNGLFCQHGRARGSQYLCTAAGMPSLKTVAMETAEQRRSREHDERMAYGD
jgi:hypothetical protein